MIIDTHMEDTHSGDSNDLSVPSSEAGKDQKITHAGEDAQDKSADRLAEGDLEAVHKVGSAAEPLSDLDIAKAGRDQLEALVADGKVPAEALTDFYKLTDPQQKEVFAREFDEQTPVQRQTIFNSLELIVAQLEKIPVKPQDENKLKRLIQLLLTIYTWLMSREIHGKAMETIAGDNPELQVLELRGGEVFKNPEVYGIHDLDKFCSEIIEEGNGNTLLEQIEYIPASYHSGIVQKCLIKSGRRRSGRGGILQVLEVLPKCRDLDEAVAVLLSKTGLIQSVQAILDNLPSFKSDDREKVVFLLLKNKNVTLNEVFQKILEFPDEDSKKALIVKILAQKEDMLKKMYKYFDVGTLKAINALLPDLSEQIAEFNKPKSTEEEYFDLIHRLRLTVEQKDKLKEVIYGYEEAVHTAKEFDLGIVVPSREEVIASIMKMGTKKLEKIASIMDKPELIINPANLSFEQMIKVMNENLYHKYQGEVSCYDEDLLLFGKQNKVRVSIVDMVDQPAVVPGQFPGKHWIDKQYRVCEKYFHKNGMEMIDHYQYAMAMQRSLRAYAAAKKKGEPNPEKYILDFGNTVTFMNISNNPSKNIRADGGFYNTSPRNHIYIRSIDLHIKPFSEPTDFRGRGAVELIFIENSSGIV